MSKKTYSGVVKTGSIDDGDTVYKKGDVFKCSSEAQYRKFIENGTLEKNLEIDIPQNVSSSKKNKKSNEKKTETPTDNETQINADSDEIDTEDVSLDVQPEAVASK